MRFLLIWPAPGVLGGVETLIARMSRWLIREGHEVSLLVERGGNWVEHLPSEARCLVLGDRFRELNYYYHAKRLWRELDITAPDVIKSFDLGSSWIASQLAEIVNRDCKVIAGMYGSFLFKWYYASRSLNPWSAAKLYVENYLRHIPASARLVCGVDQIEELEDLHKQRCVLWPIPIDITVFDSATREPKRGRIVSVGRMDAMKPYNLYMIDVVKALRAKGYDVTWSVYGTGDHEPAIRKRVKQEGLEDVIRLEGTVLYHRFSQVLAGAHVFVGMGTAILEASLLGVPNVYAIAYDQVGVTYGPIYRVPSGSIGPSLSSPPTLKVADEIERILRLSDSEYGTEVERVRRHVAPHEIGRSMGRFLELVRGAESFKRQRSTYLANYPRWLITQILGDLQGERMIGHPSTPFYYGTRAATRSARAS